MCLFVFCLACNKASHGAASCILQETAILGEVAGDEEEEEKNKDYGVFEAMLRKSGPKR